MVGRPRDTWSVAPGDLPPARAVARDRRLAGMEENAVFRLLKHRGRRRWTQGGGAPIGHEDWLYLMLALPLLGSLLAMVHSVVVLAKGTRAREDEPIVDRLSARELVEFWMAGMPAEDLAAGLWGIEASRSPFSRFIGDPIPWLGAIMAGLIGSAGAWAGASAWIAAVPLGSVAFWRFIRFSGEDYAPIHRTTRRLRDACRAQEWRGGVDFALSLFVSAILMAGLSWTAWVLAFGIGGLVSSEMLVHAPGLLLAFCVVYVVGLASVAMYRNKLDQDRARRAWGEAQVLAVRLFEFVRCDLEEHRWREKRHGKGD